MALEEYFLYEMMKRAGCSVLEEYLLKACCLQWGKYCCCCCLQQKKKKKERKGKRKIVECFASIQNWRREYQQVSMIEERT